MKKLVVKLLKLGKLPISFYKFIKEYEKVIFLKNGTFPANSEKMEKLSNSFFLNSF
jgi:hypothetical protein